MINGCLCLVALFPSIGFTMTVYTRCDAAKPRDYTDVWSTTCSLSLTYPLVMANILFFVNVSVGFWLIGLAQRSFWLIDPYWTLIPPLLGHLYQLHPNARFNEARSAL